ncbi:prenyltransferase [Cellulomonas denverensis]|uniref:Prenyltransferase n=1 Tax=Cellulomonas denverensis TaxID=264297 RepID=A0A7X6QYE1_9CELL|nr:prenyltransferase [Cellulomonas denverensis]NKY22045.1 prenyltransferase [Cellulomonas denverensis]GIG27216.1 prenyltransferase [Cellulomonas denverensis]
MHTQSDVEAVLSHRHDLGGDLWTTPDLRLGKGAPFSALESPLLLLDLGMDPDEPVLRDSAELVLSTWRPDGRFAVYPHGAILPCHTAAAARLLCRLGRADDPRVVRCLEQLLDGRHDDGGWRCRKFSYGRGPETELSNPMPTLVALDAFRHTTTPQSPALDQAVETLLRHWTTRAPVGPCHYGIGTLFHQVSFPFRAYNLFYWVYVLSFYPAARTDPRFAEAFAALRSTLMAGQIVVQRVVPKLARLEFCRPGRPSATATARYREIVHNLAAERDAG